MTNKIFLYLITLAFAFGCSQKSNHSEEQHKNGASDVHSHEEPKILITAYNDEYELFAEADPLKAGETSSVLAHFTRLSDFKPLESASITARFTLNGNETNIPLQETTRKGIYTFRLATATQGSGHLLFDVKTANGESKIDVSGISVYKNEEEADKAAEAAEISQAGATAFTKEQAWKSGFATGLPETGLFGQAIKTVAHVEAANSDEYIVVAKTSGIVRFSAGTLTEGEIIKAGQTLFTIAGNSLADNNSEVRYTEAKNNFERAKADFDRLSALAKDKIVSEKEILSAKNEYENAKAAYENLEKNFSATGQTVSSPANGFIKQIMAVNGQYTETGQPLAVVSQNRTLILHADIQQKYAPYLAMVNSANIRTTYDNKTYTLEELNGKILSYGKSAANGNFLVPFSLQIENNGKFTEGNFVELFLKTQAADSALTVPDSALLEEQGNYFVFVQLTPELFEKREIKAGATDGSRTEVTNGLGKNERIVTRGAILVKLSQSSGALDPHAGHVH